MPLEKPRSVADSPFKSAKWDELCEDRDFREADAPVLALLCAWYEVVDRCMADIDVGGGVQVAYSNQVGDIKALPQLSTMKQASAEIRALNKQLGIDDEAAPARPAGKVVPLHVIQAMPGEQEVKGRGCWSSLSEEFACPRRVCTVFKSVPPPSSIVACMWRSSCILRVGKPIASR